jgi:ribonuclease J
MIVPLLKGLKGKKMSKITLPRDELLFLPLGGCGEIGMNLNLYGYNGKWIMVDLGITFGQELGIEIITPDPDFIVRHKKDLLGLVVTHAHEDHIGAIPYLWHKLECPVYATPFTSYIIREKLKDAGLLKVVPLYDVPLNGSVDLGPFQVEYVTLTHSIPEPNALAIHTPVGTVVHTGDWKIDPHPLVGETTDEGKLKALGDKGVLALVCDSTNVFEEGHTESEEDVRKSLINLIQKQKGRVVVACFASNVARMVSCAEAAEKTGRRMGLVGRSLLRMEAAARHSGYMKAHKTFLTEGELMNLDRSQTLMVCTGSQGEARSALARIASGQHPRVKLSPGDTVIFSSRMIPGNEQSITDLQEKLLEQGIIVISDEHEFTHVSGHPAQGDLKDMYRWVRPQILVPVHGEAAHLREQASFGQSCGIPQNIIPSNGDIISLSAKGGPQLITQVPVGRLALDGNQLVPIKADILKARQRISTEGVIVASLHFKKNNTLQQVMISFCGLNEEHPDVDIIDTLRRTISSRIKEMESDDIGNDNRVEDAVRAAVRRVMKAWLNKKPMVITHIFR